MQWTIRVQLRGTRDLGIAIGSYGDQTQFAATDASVLTDRLERHYNILKIDESTHWAGDLEEDHDRLRETRTSTGQLKSWHDS